MKPTKLEKIKADKIEIPERFRKDYGDIGELAEDIRTNGLICPIAVMEHLLTRADVGGEKAGSITGYRLLAGGRRLQAVKLLGWKEIPCNVYDHELSDLELRMIELAENIMRKELSFIEEVNLKREIHRLQQQLLGPGKVYSAGGHTLKDTAALLGKKSAGSLLMDIQLADAMEKFPELDWDKCKTKAEARKLVGHMEEVFIRSELAKRAEQVLGPKSKKQADSFVVMDFFEHVKRLPSEAFDLVEIDPPFGIDLPDIKLTKGAKSGEAAGNKFAISYGSSYNEIPSSEYEAFLKEVLPQIYRVMSERSWLIFWFGPDPWFETVYRCITSVGLGTRRLCGIWAKPTGQVHNPDIHLANAYEMFFYARKGSAIINPKKQGRSNIFNFAPVHPSKKVHPTEKPVELYEELFATFGWEGARIYVPFCGSGNALRAAHNLNMHSIGCDLGKEYKDAYVTRIVRELDERR
jgi:ParB/RepB/Spo0J family partition protein